MCRYRLEAKDKPKEDQVEMPEVEQRLAEIWLIELRTLNSVISNKRMIEKYSDLSQSSWRNIDN